MRQATVIERPNTHVERPTHIPWRAGLPSIRFHDLRHTFATLHLAAGTNSKIGHKEVAISLDRYSDALPTLR